LRNQLQQALLGLGILIGRPPEAVLDVVPGVVPWMVPGAAGTQPGTLTDLALPAVAPGLPSALLLRRPDVAEAEAQLVAAHFSVAMARAAFFPTIQLTASGGFANAALNTLFTPGRDGRRARRRADAADLRCRHAARAVGAGEGAV